jgi:MYXO-CTERM domain-containing protein
LALRRPQLGNNRAFVSAARWAAYATAGAASAVTAPSIAYGEVHYFGIVDQQVAGNVVKFPLTSGISLGLNQFTGPPPQSFGVAHVFLSGTQNGLFADQYLTYGGLYAYRLRQGLNVSAQNFDQSCSTTSSSQRICWGRAAEIASGQNTTDPFWKTRGGGYIGFSFNRGSGLQYGWARIKTTGPPKFQVLVVDFAWADPGERIKTGQKSSRGDLVNDVASAGSLGMLGLGAVGLALWRQRRREFLE